MENQFKQIAALIGDPVRAGIMWTLMDGKALTATELALHADTSPQNISMHLSKLLQADLLSVEKQGRHRYYRFSRNDIAYAIESMARLMPDSGEKKNLQAEYDMAIRYGRTCYDHLAGKMGVAITDAMVQQHLLVRRNDNFEITRQGGKWFSELGICVDELKTQRRSLIRPCLDWTERRPHIAGSLAAALLDFMISSDWIRRTKNSRVVLITGIGQKKIHQYLKLSL
ncbi:MAG TPA: winged helix-turn-helix domain-containing protein [Puia sp.]|nr:winged helix-turn-helix domain-containing protein [Puia sp.]